MTYNLTALNKILIAGATGYLGSYVAEECKRQNYFTRLIVRDIEKLDRLQVPADDIMAAQLTDPSALAGCCKGIDVVFSCVGITKQKDGLTYMDVDYQANINLLEEAKKSGVRKFIYVAVLHGKHLIDLKICNAKEKFVKALETSGLDYCIIRPTGYFSDMAEFYSMAEKGRVFLFGNGNHRMNPIHGEDLAKVCVDAIQSRDKEILAGGPDILTHNQIARTAFGICGREQKITHIPYWASRLVLLILRTFTSSKFYGPIEFFMAVLSMDMIAPQYGTHHLKTYFEELKTTKENKNIVQ